MKGVKPYLAGSMLIASLMLGSLGVAYAQSGNGAYGNLNPAGIFESIKSIFSQAEKLTAQGVEATDAAGEGSGEWGEIAGRVWQAVKDFFSDKTVRELLIDTLKLFIQLAVNIFTIIANVLSRILGALSSGG